MTTAAIPSKNGKVKTEAVPVPQPTVAISEIAAERLRVPIIGTSPLIAHRFSEKAKKTMLDAAQGRKNPKQPKDPEAEYLAAAYLLDDGSHGVPSIAFKAATVSAARFYGKQVSMTSLRQTLFFDGEMSQQAGQKLVRIEGEPRMREDVVRVGMGSADLRYRPEYPQWRADLTVVYVSSLLTRESVISLINAGGMGVGVGEWRPERNGDFGCYTIDPDRAIEVIGG